MNQERLPNQSIRETMRPNHDEYKLIDNPQEILETWGSEISKAGPGDKVWFRTMRCWVGETMGYLEPRLKAAAQNGADVRIIYDPISHYETYNGTLALPSYMGYLPVPGLTEIKAEYTRNINMENRLRESGVRMDYSRPEELSRQIFPYKGADHIKGVRIRDRFWYSSDNLEDISFQQMNGFVVEIPNPELIKELTKIIGSTTSPDEDKVISINSEPETEIIWDAGIPGKSTIYETALKMIQNEDNFVGTALQFIPDGRFLATLQNADKRNVSTQVVTSPQKFFGNSVYYLINRMAAKKLVWRTDSLPKAFLKEAASGFHRAPQADDFRVAFANTGVHAKYVVTPTEVEFGTNNHNELGIKAGTAELAIHSTNPQLVELVRKYHDRLFHESLATQS